MITMDWVLILGFLWLLWIPSYVSAGVASVVLERACEVYRSPGTYLAYQGETKYLKCLWNGTEDVQSFSWTLNGAMYSPPSDHVNRSAKRQVITIDELDESHAGDWICTIRTVDNVTATAKLKLELQGLPVIYSTPSDAVYGHNVTLTCRHSIINVTNIIWFEDGNSLYDLNRGWVKFSGDGAYSKSITILLAGKHTFSAQSYDCRVSSELMCGGSYNLQRLTGTKKSKDFPLDIKYPIELALSTTKSHISLSPNEDFNVNCSHVKGNQPSSVVWYKDGTPIDQLDTLQVVVLGSGKLLKIYKAKSYHAGVYTCNGYNEYGQDSKSFNLAVNGNANDHSIDSVVKLSDTPGVGTKARLACIDTYITIDINNVDWYKDEVMLVNTHSRYVYNENILIIPSLRRSDQGIYSCRYTDKDVPVNFYSTKFQLDVVDVPPRPVNLTVLVNSTTDNSLIISWAYSTEHDTNATSIKIVADFADGLDNSRVENTLECTEKSCPTQYTLRGLAPGTLYSINVISINDFGHTSSESKLHTTNISQQLTEKSPDEYMKVVVGVVAGCLVVFFALGYAFFRRHKKDYKKKVYDKIERELGFTISKTLKPDPYEYEYANLRFQDTLGEGAFGKVLKAEAPGLKCPQGSQTVAVKMCKVNCSDDGENEYDRQELLSEIEILMKLGVHQHIIPLLGSCTKRGRPTCLITQYMPDGDLQNYLRISRPSFVGTYPFRPLTADSFQVNIHKMSNLCTSDDTLTSKDLISFARQIACGMEYVAAQKVVHRDIAARNVLVASKRSLKITDFGLAREMRGVNEEYVMGPNRKVPYRWLAPESFFEKKFTVHSDVWAYGVLLYEILTLGGSPYPRHTIRDIPEMLKHGYRMDPPTNSKPELNQLMSLCWNETPESRPSFTQIKTLLDELLGDRPDEYLDCGDPDADILPNINSNDNKEVFQDKLFRYSFLASRRDISSIAVQGYDRIADAHSAYNTLDTIQTLHQPQLHEIKSNPIPDTYQHLPVVEPSPDQSRKNSAQYMNHETGMLPVIVQPDFICQAENFVAQKL